MTVGCNYGQLGTGCKAVEYGLIWAELIYFCLVGPLPLARPPCGFGMVGQNQKSGLAELVDCDQIANIVLKIHDIFLFQGFNQTSGYESCFKLRQRSSTNNSKM